MPARTKTPPSATSARSRKTFFNIFGGGNSSTSISTIDPSGIALAGIQALDAKGEQQDRELADLNQQLDARTEEIRSLHERLARLESLLDRTNK
jgi:hypothetical protein